MCLHYIGNEIVSSPHREKRRLKLDSGAYSVFPIFFCQTKRDGTLWILWKCRWRNPL